MSRTAKTARKRSEYVAYYRVSTVKQGQSGLGLEAQRASVERYIAAAQGTLMMEYVEVESGKKDDRPQLAAAIGHAKRLDAVLVIAKLDRLARSVAFISRLMEEATEFVACDMPMANRLTLHIMAAMAEHEREMISARTKAALEAAKQRGAKLGNPKWQDALIIANRARQKPKSTGEVVSILRAQQDAGKSLREIAFAMNSLGIKTASGAVWHPSSVRAALLAA